VTASTHPTVCARVIRRRGILTDMLRRPRIAASVCFSILCVALIVLWVRSYWRTDMALGPRIQHKNCLAVSSQGRVDFVALATPPRVGASKTWQYHSVEIREPRRRAAFASNYAPSDISYVRVPHWFAALVFAMFATAPAARLSSLRQFSLRTLLIIVTLVALAFAALAAIV